MKASTRRRALRVSNRAPGSSAGLSEYLTISPASVLMAMTRCSASLSAVDFQRSSWLDPEGAGPSNRYRTETHTRFARAGPSGAAPAKPTAFSNQGNLERWNMRTHATTQHTNSAKFIRFERESYILTKRVPGKSPYGQPKQLSKGPTPIYDRDTGARRKQERVVVTPHRIRTSSNHWEPAQRYTIVPCF